MLLDLQSALVAMINSGLLVDEIIHGLVAIPFSLFLYSKTKSVKLSLIVVLLVYAIDVDHLVDYWSYYGFKFSFVEFVSLKYFVLKGTAYVPFHAWEWLLILIYFVRKYGWKTYYASFALGLLAHLIWDVKTVGDPVFYSITYRILTRFIIPFDL